MSNQQTKEKPEYVLIVSGRGTYLSFYCYTSEQDALKKAYLLAENGYSVKWGVADRLIRRSRPPVEEVQLQPDPRVESA